MGDMDNFNVNLDFLCRNIKLDKIENHLIRNKLIFGENYNKYRSLVSKLTLMFK